MSVQISFSMLIYDYFYNSLVHNMLSLFQWCLMKTFITITLQNCVNS